MLKSAWRFPLRPSDRAGTFKRFLSGAIDGPDS